MKLKSLAPFILLIAASLALLDCGGGSSSAGGSSPTPAGGIAVCANGTVASYLNTSCSQQSAVYIWQSYSCTSTPTTICDGLGVKGANIQMKMDPQGPSTSLVGETTLWNVNANELVHVTIGGLIYGATANQNWPHFNGQAGQIGDGTEDNKTTVSCGSGCSDAMQGVSDVLCSSTSPVAFCTDQPNNSPYPAPARFVAATASNPYALTIEITLNGGTAGSATFWSVGTHLGNL